MIEQTIKSEDMTLKRAFQDFYVVPNYQREYVWGETNAKGQQGDEVNQFLADILVEFQGATDQSAPEYFIGTVVVCANSEGIYELIDGQQRLTTTFLTLCAIRDELQALDIPLPPELPAQIAAASTDWQDQTTYRERLTLQYDDSQGVLSRYAQGEWSDAPQHGTRSIANIASAYKSVRDFLKAQFQGNKEQIRKFYAYLVNKVKLIRIETASVAKALKIFETVNDRGAGLDAMDLLKNLLFMSASSEDFEKLKDLWKQIVDAIYRVREKPLRFLRYFVFAEYDVADLKLQEDGIYDWFLRNSAQTQHDKNPIAFAKRLLDAAQAYAHFIEGNDPEGKPSHGIRNTRTLGGTAVRQHFMLLLAGRRLSAETFNKLAVEVEQLMFVYLITDTPTRDYERSIIEGAKQLRGVSPANFEEFAANFFRSRKAAKSKDFNDHLSDLYSGYTRYFRLRYMLAKFNQHIDLQAFGNQPGYVDLHAYLDGCDVEHIFAIEADQAAVKEFGTHEDEGVMHRLGNLIMIEAPINRLLGNRSYSAKRPIYEKSKFLFPRCQAAAQTFGKADQITKAIQGIPAFSDWNEANVLDRQVFLVDLAKTIWGVPPLEAKTDRSGTGGENEMQKVAH